MNLKGNFKKLDYIPSAEDIDEVKKRIWQQIHCRILCTLMVVQYSTRVVLKLFPIFNPKICGENIRHFDDFLIDKESYSMTQRKVFELIDNKCATGIRGIKCRNLLQMKCQLRRKIFSCLPFILSECYFVPFLSCYIQYAREICQSFDFLAELLVKAAKYYLITTNFEFSANSSHTRPLVQMLALINTRWKRNRKNCLKFQVVWNKIGTNFDFRLVTSNERLKNDDRNLAKSVYRILQHQCKSDYIGSLSYICSEMNDNQMLGGTTDEIMYQLMKTSVIKKTKIAVFEATCRCIFSPQSRNIPLPATSSAADIDMNVSVDVKDETPEVSIGVSVIDEEKQIGMFPGTFSAVENSYTSTFYADDDTFHAKDMNGVQNRSEAANLYLSPPSFVKISDVIRSGGGFCLNGNIFSSVDFNSYTGQGQSMQQNSTGNMYGLPLQTSIVDTYDPITFNVFVIQENNVDHV